MLYDSNLRDDSHEGHRTRLRNRAWDEGLLSMEEHEVIELLLFYAVPRRDVNDIGHQLIDRFGSIAGILNASYEDLVSVPGVGDKAGRLFQALSRAVNAYRALPELPVPVIRTRKDAIDYALTLFKDEKRVQTWVALVNSGGCVEYASKMFTGSAWYTDKIRLYIAERALQHDAHEVIILSHRMIDFAGPTQSDRESLKELAKSLAAIDVYILDFILIGKNRHISMRQTADIGLSRRELPRMSDDLREQWLSDSGDVEEEE